MTGEDKPSRTLVRTVPTWVEVVRTVALLFMSIALGACVWIIYRQGVDEQEDDRIAAAVDVAASHERERTIELVRDLRRQLAATTTQLETTNDIDDCYDTYTRVVARASDLKDARLGEVLAAAGDVIIGTPLLDAISLFNDATDRYAQATQESATAVAARDAWVAGGQTIPCPLE